MPVTETDTLLVFRIAGIPFAVPAESVGSILMPPSHITHTPGSNRSSPGIFHHAQFTYVVIDLHERFGIDTPRTKTGRLLLQDEGVRHFSFLVDEVVGLVRSEQGRWANLPHYLPQEVFSIGFLYQDEIVLCSELQLLRNMHDVEPLRRHFAQLLQQAESANEKPKLEKETTTETVKSTTKETTEVTGKTDPADDATLEEKIPSPQDADIATEASTPFVEKRTEPSPPETTKAPSASVESEVRHTQRDHSADDFAKTTVPKSPPVHTPLPERTTAVTHRPPSTRPSQRSHQQPTATGTDYSLLWLFLFLALIVAIPTGYWLWPSQRVSLPTATTQTPPPAVQMDTPATEATPPPLRIEKDEEGTINLIIDRKAAEAVSESGSPKTAATTSTLEQTATDVPVPTTTEVAPQNEKPTAASTSSLEPCDCTHIVVKGDTLWDIAERYTGNAFNYPDLAKQSGIRNPHRIYPGNKVRIIIR